MANKSVIVKDTDILINEIVRNGLSYRQLAEKAQVSQTTISLIVNGERNPSAEVAVRICQALNCQFDDIFLIKMFTTVNKE